MLRWRLTIGPVLIAALVGLFVLDAKAGRGAPYLYGFCLFLVIRSVWELQYLLKVRSFAPNFWLVLVGCLGILTANWLPWWRNPQPLAGSMELLGPVFVAYALSAIAAFVSGAARYRAPGATMETLGAELLGLTYIGVLISLTAQLRWVSPLNSLGVPEDVGYLALASLVVAKGPLLEPKLTLDARGVASAALSIGAAAATGGLSALGQGLVRQASDPHPCVFAQTGVAAKPAAQPASPGAPGGSKPPAGKPDDVRQLLRNLFR